MSAMSMYVVMAAIALTVPLAHGVAWVLTRSRRVAPGFIQEIMPVLPAAKPVSGSAARRWDARIRRAESALLERFKEGARGAEASALAGPLGEDVAVVEEALARLREEIPCRLRVTRGGRLLHDFEASDIAQLRSRRARSLPLRVLLTGLAAFANVGAAWPVLALGLGAGYTLYDMLQGPEEARLVTGLTGLGLLAAFFVGNVVAGWLVHALLTPALVEGPRLGDLVRSEAPRVRGRSASSSDELGSGSGGSGGGGGIWFWDATPTWGASSSSSWGGRASSSSSDGGDGGGGDGDLGEAILVVIVVVVLLAIVAATMAVVVMWLRGIYRSIKRGEEPEHISPSDWVRHADIIDWSERYLPTNDLVLRTLRALRRAFAHRRPQDTDMGSRVLLLAKKRGGVVSALDIVLHEGLSMSESIELGVRVAALAGGQLRTSDDGELAFAFPPRLIRAPVGVLSEDMEAEYIALAQGDEVRFERRSNQPADKAPVNIVGLTRGHLMASGRLVAGTFSMALLGSLVLLSTPGLPAVAVYGGVAALLVMALSTAVLSATARYAARASAFEGMLRDLRRGVLIALRRAVERGDRQVNLAAVADRVEGGFGALGSLPEAMVDAELTAIAVDLELEPLAAGGKPHRYDLRPFVERVRRAREGATSLMFDDEARLDEAEAEAVVFDTAVEHAQVRVLA